MCTITYSVMAPSQISMNVLQVRLTFVIQMLSVQILLGLTLAHVRVDSAVMELRVLT